jgi:hypothetical protein
MAFSIVTQPQAVGLVALPACATGLGCEYTPHALSMHGWVRFGRF